MSKKKSPGPRPICKHCKKVPVNRPRGLCWNCYYAPGVKELYPSTSKYAHRGVSNGQMHTVPLPAEPCPFPPGTPEKTAELERRAAAGEALRHPKDADWKAYATYIPKEPTDEQGMAGEMP